MGSNPTRPATIWVFNWDTTNNASVQALEVELLTEFFDTIQSPVTKKKYARNLDFFILSAGIEGTDPASD